MAYNWKTHCETTLKTIKTWEEFVDLEKIMKANDLRFYGKRRAYNLFSFTQGENPNKVSYLNADGYSRGLCLIKNLHKVAYIDD